MKSSLILATLTAATTFAAAQPADPSAPPTNPPGDAGPTPVPEAQQQPTSPASAPNVAVTPVTPVVVEAAPDKKSDKPTVTWKAVPGKGATLSAGDAFSLNLRSRVNLRYQLHAAPEPMGDRAWDQLVTVNTVRLWISGHVRDPRLTYMIQLALAGRDYRDGTVSPIFDAFVDYKAHRDLSIKAGQFFVPFDRLRTVREFALQLADRPRPVTELTLDRDVGITLYSDKFLGDKSPFAWRLGAFGGGGVNQINPKKAGGLFAARVELRPLGEIDDDSEGDLQRRPKPALALGLGVATNRNSNRLRSTTGTPFTGGTTDYVHLSADATFKYSGAALQLEYLKKTSSEVSFASAADPAVREHTRAGSGFVVQASYVFDPPVEIVGRYSHLWAPGGTDPKWITEVRNLGRELAAGVNYYLAGHQLKLQADWIVRTPRNSFDTSDHVMHAQLDATF